MIQLELKCISALRGNGVYSLFWSTPCFFATSRKQTFFFHFLKMVVDGGKLDLGKIRKLLSDGLFYLVSVLRSESLKQAKNVKWYYYNHLLSQIIIVSVNYYYTQY